MTNIQYPISKTKQVKKYLTFDIRNLKFDIPRRGFTLIELLVYMGLMSLLLIALTTIFVTIIDTQLNAQTTSYVSQDGRYIYSRLIYDINRATSVSQPKNLGDSTPSASMVINGNTATFGLSGGNIVMTDSTGSYPLNSFGTTISNLTFKRVGNTGITNPKDTFQINFRVSGNRPADSSPEIKDFQTTAGLR